MLDWRGGNRLRRGGEGRRGGIKSVIGKIGTAMKGLVRNTSRMRTRFCDEKRLLFVAFMLQRGKIAFI